MKAKRYTPAGAELLLIFPACLFLTAVFLRGIQPLQFEPAHTAQRIVDWYAARPQVGLWLLLIAFPMAVLTSGSVLLLRRWRHEPETRQVMRDTLVNLRNHLSTWLVAAATAAAFGILAIVALHMLTD